MKNTTTQKILLIGAQGQLGQYLKKDLNNWTQNQSAEVLAVGREKLDLRDPDKLRELVRGYQPSIIINAAAHTNVDQAEKEKGLAFAINATAPGILAEEVERSRAFLVHYSTDYVFSGLGNQAWKESDPCDPQSVYGASKWAGEQAVTANTERAAILRTSWVYSAEGNNFMLTMLKLARQLERLEVIDDQFGVPTWVGRLSEVTLQALNVHSSDSASKRPPFNGIFHVCPRGETTWFKYAQEVFRQRSDAQRKLKELVPISSERYLQNMLAKDPSRIVAKRPSNSRMDCSKLEHALAITLPEWQEDLQRCLSQLD